MVSAVTGSVMASLNRKTLVNCKLWELQFSNCMDNEEVMRPEEHVSLNFPESHDLQDGDKYWF